MYLVEKLMQKHSHMYVLDYLDPNNCGFANISDYKVALFSNKVSGKIKLSKEQDRLSI